MNILNEILDAKRIEIANQATLVSMETLLHAADNLPPPPSFSKVFAGKKIGIIAEVKRRSPSAGLLRDPFDPAEIARAYAAGGAGAISVLMDEAYFGGGEEQFRAVREAVKLPLLYKEFVIDPWQVWHARSLGASAILLIAAALTERDLRDLISESEQAGLEVLLEVHDRGELESALALKAPIIGINNRDLRTFETSLDTTVDLAKGLPAETILISESGIKSPDDMKRLIKAGVRGVLVGEHFLRQPDLSSAVKALRGK